MSDIRVYKVLGGALVVLALCWFQRRRSRARVTRSLMVELARWQPGLERTYLPSFEHLDHKYYQQRQSEAEKAGFRLLGDFTDIHPIPFAPDGVCRRLMVSDDGRTIASIIHMRFWMPTKEPDTNSPAEFSTRYVGLVSRVGQTILCTTEMPGPSYPDMKAVSVKPGSRIESMNAHHLKEVAALTRDGETADAFDTFDEILAFGTEFDVITQRHLCADAGIPLPPPLPPLDPVP
ncbi:MAG: hypothetical protein CMJ83_22055 [Planctomycetes bacterium]|nr:hypothetical protein [Planctomycetota bacterium]